MNATGDLVQHLTCIQELARRLTASSAEITAIEYNYSFGSWSVSVHRNGRWFRADFDGRGRVLLISSTAAPGEPRKAVDRYLIQESFPDSLTPESFDAVLVAILKGTSAAQ